MPPTEVLLIALLIAVLALVALRLQRRPTRPTRPTAPTRPSVPRLPAGTEVRWTTHARERMSQRGVSSDNVRAVVTRPERAVADAAEGSVRLERDLGGRTLKVWVVAPWPPEREAVVKSTAWADYTGEVTVPRASLGRVIGKGGATIRGIRSAHDARIVQDGTTFRISADDADSVRRAQQSIRRAARI